MLLDTMIELGSDFISNMIKPTGRFIYGIKTYSLEELSGYNVLRHAGSLWSLILAKKEYKLNTVLLSKKKYDDKIQLAMDYLFIKFYKNLYSHGCIVEDGFIKLGGNGLALLALNEFIESNGNRIQDFNDEFYIGNKLTQYMLNCITDNGSIIKHKVKISTMQETKFHSDFYNGEMLLSLLRFKKFLIPLHIERTDNKVTMAVKKLYEDREKTYHVKDHWLMQALELAVGLLDNSFIYDFMKKIVRATLDDDIPEIACACACRVEALTAYLNFAKVILKLKNNEVEYYDEVMQKIKDYFEVQKVCFIFEGKFKGGIYKTANIPIIRTDYVQHNICSFMRLKNVEDFDGGI